MNEIRLAVTQEDRRIAGLAALAVGLTLAEASLPSPIPGVKPGLANIVILLVMLRYGFGSAVWVMVMRLFAASLMLGSFLSPGFWLASAGAAASMGVLYLARQLPKALFGPVSYSVLMAFAHIGGQLILAKYWLFTDANIVLLIPVFALAALVFGAVNGLIVARLAMEDILTNTQSNHA